MFYFENWTLAFASVDYYNVEGALQSPLQHFWSLSIQGQVFLLFPIAIALCALVFRRRRALIRQALVVLFVAVFATSLWWSIVETQVNQSFAYFDTRTRIWEFAAGSIIALAQQLTEPLDAVAEQRGMGLIRSIYLACPVGFAEEPLGLEWMIPDDCQAWRAAVLDYALELEPDAVYLVATTARFDQPERLQYGIDDFIEPLLDSGTEIIAVRRTPRFADRPGSE